MVMDQFPQDDDQTVRDEAGAASPQEQDEQNLDAAAASQEEGAADDDQQVELDPRLLLSDDEEQQAGEPEEDYKVRLARLETENRMLREMRESPSQGQPQGQGVYGQDLGSKVSELTDEINRLQQELPPEDPENPQQTAQRYIKMQDILDKRQTLADLKDELRDARVQAYETTAAMDNYKRQARKTDSNFNDPVFEQAFDEYVRREIPEHMRTNPQVLDLARSKIGYRYLQLKGKRGGSQGRDLEDGVQQRGGGAPPRNQRGKAPQLSDQQRTVADFYQLDASDFDGRYGSAEENEYDLGAIKYTHVRGRR